MAKENKVYDYVTERILDRLEKGVVPWKKPWDGGVSYNFESRRPYNGMNTFLLPQAGGYVTFKQAQKMGGKIKKGEKGHMITFWRMLKRTEKDENGDRKESVFPLLRYYTVFHLSQTEGIEYSAEDMNGTAHDVVTCSDAEDVVAAYIANGGPALEKVKGNDAYYAPRQDKVVVPLQSQFAEQEKYYSTLFHELTHSTGSGLRLARFNSAAMNFGNYDYGKEELVAELGAAMLCQFCGIASDNSEENSAAYIASWMKTIKADKKLFVQAAGLANKAVRYIKGEKISFEQ